MSMCPAPDLRATPCLMAFSTSGCSSSVGTSASQRLRLHVVADDETVGEARAFDLEVLAQEVELVLRA